MMLVDFSSVELSEKIAMRVLSFHLTASGLFWNAAQSEFICFDDDDVDPRSTRPTIRSPDLIYASALPRFVPSRPSGQRNAAISELKRSTICIFAAQFGNKVILIK
jgi:hypothetical protein